MVGTYIHNVPCVLMRLKFTLLFSTDVCEQVLSQMHSSQTLLDSKIALSWGKGHEVVTPGLPSKDCAGISWLFGDHLKYLSQEQDAITHPWLRWWSPYSTSSPIDQSNSNYLKMLSNLKTRERDLQLSYHTSRSRAERYRMPGRHSSS